MAMTNGSPPRAAEEQHLASPGCGTAVSTADRGIRAEQLEPCLSSKGLSAAMRAAQQPKKNIASLYKNCTDK